MRPMVHVVDDDESLRTALLRLLKGSGFEATGYSSTGEFLLHHPPDRHGCVLLDIYLPDMSGLEVLQHLRERGTAVDALMVTAARDVATIRTALRGGIVNYIIKPFTFDALRDRLERYAAAHRTLTLTGPVGQDDVDRLFSTLRPTTMQLPKGLTRATADLVARVLQNASADLSAAECAEQAGLSRVSTRRYLEYLVSLGKADLRLRYGVAGRPEHRYRWTEAPPS